MDNLRLTVKYKSFILFIGRNNKPQKNTKAMKETTIATLFFILILAILGWRFSTATDKSLRNQDTMLCESATISGNQKYLQKCSCYYESGDINCIEDH